MHKVWAQITQTIQELKLLSLFTSEVCRKFALHREVDGWMDGWLDGWIAAGVRPPWVRRRPPHLLSPSAAVIGAPFGVQVPNAPEKDLQQGCSSTPVLTTTHVPSPKRYYLLRGKGMFSKTVMGPRGARNPSHRPDHPHLAFGITRLRLANLLIHPHMAQGHTLIVVPAKRRPNPSCAVSRRKRISRSWCEPWQGTP